MYSCSAHRSPGKALILSRWHGSGAPEHTESDRAQAELCRPTGWAQASGQTVAALCGNTLMGENYVLPKEQGLALEERDFKMTSADFCEKPKLDLQDELFLRNATAG